MKINLQYDDEKGLREVKTSLTDPTLEEVLDAFGDFLRAAGYMLDANEDIVVWQHAETKQQRVIEWEKEDEQ